MENKVINYTNLDTNTKLNLEVDKKMIFVYGKNGTGKTTLSRSKDLEPKYVFNEDFIYKNVYVIETEGAKIDSNIKNNFSGLLIGEDVVALRYEQTKYEKILKELLEIEKKLNGEIEKQFIESGIPMQYNSLKQITDIDKFEYDFNKELEEQLNNYNSKYVLEQKILDNDTLEKYINQIRKQEILKKLLEKIKNIDLLHEYLISNEKKVLNYLNHSLLYLKENVSAIKELERLAEQKKINKDNFNLVEEIIKLQESSGSLDCIICGKSDPSKGIKEWKKIIYDKSISLKQDIKNKLCKYKEEAEKIIQDKEIYESIAKKTMENIEYFIEVLNNIINSLDTENIKLIEFNKKAIENLTLDINEKLIAIGNYILKPYKDKLIFCNTVKVYFNNLIDLTKKSIEKKLIENAENHKVSINNILEKLGLNKEINVKVDRMGGQIKYSLAIDNGKISELSDGQKHKLALAVFLNSIKGLDLSNKIIVFDDPVVAMDEYSYHLFKNYLINEVMTKDEKCPNLLILTHNFSYLYIQISNIITNEELLCDTKIVKIYPNKIREMNIDLFKLDDIALFKKAIENLRYNSQLINLSSLYNKIFREFLDLKLRLSGFPLNGNPKEEICSLNIEQVKKEILIKNNTKICDCSKDINVTLEKAKEGFELLVDSINMLGFCDYLSEEDRNRVLSLNDESEYTMEDIDIIVSEVSQILKNEDILKNQYKNYINHPRISFTKNILSTSMDI
ncbi:MAG: AAA family ATPase [Bacilli bacterium]